ncbi:MAG: YidC/Oxa1 family membrane protein insertase [Bacillota bacterium]|jgi:YidC/Oxa1 family membrane protein insertase
MSYISDGMIAIMDFVHGVTGSWGLAIVGLTVVVRVIMLPLTIMQARSNNALSIIGPEQARLQKKYKDDPERLNIEIMELYRKHKVSPFSSCLGLIIQFPILIAMIRSLDAHPVLKTSKFLGLELGKPGTLPLVLAAILSTYLAMRFSPSMSAGQQQAGNQKVVIILMLGMMAFFAFRYSAAVAIYIITANLVGLLERLVVPSNLATPEGAATK